MMLVSALVSFGAVESSRGTPNFAKSLVVTLMPNFTASEGETLPCSVCNNSKIFSLVSAKNSLGSAGDLITEPRSTRNKSASSEAFVARRPKSARSASTSKASKSDGH